jgi:hypothetical protein
MSMHIGVQLIAPDGFEQLQKGHTYHLLRSDGFTERVILMEFVQRPTKSTKQATRVRNWTPLPLPVLVCLRRSRFEAALLSQSIVKAPRQAFMPPWLEGLEQKDLRSIERQRRSTKRAHSDRIDAILRHLMPLVAHADEVLCSPDPDRLINRHARDCKPAQNGTRMRVWFYAYILFGRNRWVLHYPVHRIGRWDRMAKPERKFGRPSLTQGSAFGYGTNDQDMIDKILRGYRRFAKPGLRMSAIYRESMRKIFGCQSDKGAHGRYSFMHPDGLPFPSCNQFVYRVLQHYTRQEVQTTMYGESRARNRLRPSIGRFSESAGNLMERVEEDAYWLEEVSKGMEPGTHMPGLCVARARCIASGMIVGIGFAFGGETANAYRMMKFCMAIGKVKFCSLFNVVIEPDDWPSVGLPAHEIADRGAGSTESAQASVQAARPLIREMSPTWMGQSKASIESSHPRHIQLDGQPTFVETRLTIPQLAAREVRMTVAANDSMDASSRVNSRFLEELDRPTPLRLWNYLESRGRTAAARITFDEAVRSFLTQVAVTVAADGVCYQGQRFDSEALRATDLLDRVSTTQTVRVEAYVLDVCVRHLWVEVGDALVEVDAQLSIRDGTEQLWLSVVELEQVDRLRRRGKAALREHRQAVLSAAEAKDEEATGMSINAGHRRAGRPKRRTSASREAAKAISPHLRAVKVKA